MTGLNGLVAIEELPKIVQRGQCMGCGFCTIRLAAPASMGASAAAAKSVSYRWLPDEEHWGPVVEDRAASVRPEAIQTHSPDAERRVCPGAVMNMPALADVVFKRQPKDPMVGETQRIAVGYAKDPHIRKSAASGGVTTALLTAMFESGQIDAAYCAAGRDPRNGGGTLARSATALLPTMGSHYHPVAFGAALDELVNSDVRFAFVGLPCEIAAMREVMDLRPDVAARAVLLVGLFCGGINRFSGIGRYLKRFGIDPGRVTDIDYRHGAWPGSISARMANETSHRDAPRILGNSRWNILHYMISFQGYWMLPRCRICPDQIADFADIAVGDPHLSRFKADPSDGYSAVIARTPKGLAMLEACESAGALVLGPLTRDELVKSQGYTLENRRHSLVYTAMARHLDMQPPTIEVYEDLRTAKSRHQHVYAFVDLIKIKYRHVQKLRSVYVLLQIFEYLFLTLSPRLFLARFGKLLSNR